MGVINYRDTTHLQKKLKRIKGGKQNWGVSSAFNEFNDTIPQRIFRRDAIRYNIFHYLFHFIPPLKLNCPPK